MSLVDDLLRDDGLTPAERLRDQLVYIAGRLEDLKFEERDAKAWLHPSIREDVKEGKTVDEATASILTVITNIRTHLLMRQRQFRRELKRIERPMS